MNVKPINWYKFCKLKTVRVSYTVILNQNSKPMSDSTYTKIFSGSFIIVQLALDRLQSAGIHPVVKDESESGRLAGFGASIQGYQELYVSEEERSQAERIISSVKNEIEP